MIHRSRSDGGPAKRPPPCHDPHYPATVGIPRPVARCPCWATPLTGPVHVGRRTARVVGDRTRTTRARAAAPRSGRPSSRPPRLGGRRDTSSHGRPRRRRAARRRSRTRAGRAPRAPGRVGAVRGRGRRELAGIQAAHVGLGRGIRIVAGAVTRQHDERARRDRLQVCPSGPVATARDHTACDSASAGGWNTSSISHAEASRSAKLCHGSDWPSRAVAAAQYRVTLVPGGPPMQPVTRKPSLSYARVVSLDGDIRDTTGRTAPSSTTCTTPRRGVQAFSRGSKV